MFEPDQIRAFLRHIHGLRPDQAFDWITVAIEANGGTVMTPAANGAGATHLYEIALFGVAAFGQSPEHAAASWIKIATRAIESVAA